MSQDLIILKTNINYPESVSLLSVHLNQHPDIKSWSIDQEDLDKVLRVFSDTLNQDSLIAMLNQLGFKAEEL